MIWPFNRLPWPIPRYKCQSSTCLISATSGWRLWPDGDKRFRPSRSNIERSIHQGGEEKRNSECICCPRIFTIGHPLYSTHSQREKEKTTTIIINRNHYRCGRNRPSVAMTSHPTTAIFQYQMLKLFSIPPEIGRVVHQYVIHSLVPVHHISIYNARDKYTHTQRIHISETTPNGNPRTEKLFSV